VDVGWISGNALSRYLPRTTTVASPHRYPPTMRTDDADDGSWPSPPKGALSRTRMDRTDHRTGPSPRGLLLRQSLAFLLLGLINNVLYVLVLSAALDLVPAGTPKGLVALANIAPALLAKAAWPYASRGAVRYARRIAACCALSAAGMLVVAAYDTLGARLLGIALASFASGASAPSALRVSC
jgi:drug/metabolite transporter (DMT)-like permease